MNSAYESIREAVIYVASSNKVAVSVSTATTAVGAAASQDIIHGHLVNISMVLGICVTAILGCCHLVRLAISWQELKRVRQQTNKEALY